MAQEWTHIRIPKGLHARLLKELKYQQQRHHLGMGQIEPGHLDRIPTYRLVEMLLLDKIKHRKRSEKQRGRRPTQDEPDDEPDDEDNAGLEDQC